MANRLDHDCLLELQAAHCHLDMQICAVQKLQMYIRRPDTPSTMYDFKVGEQVVLAPMGLFFPAFLGLAGPGHQTTGPNLEEDPEDWLYHELPGTCTAGCTACPRPGRR